VRSDRDLKTVAARAGLLTRWRDAFGNERRVAPETLRAMLDVLNPDDLDALSKSMPPLIVADAMKPIFSVPAHFAKTKTARIELEFGEKRDCAVKQIAETKLQLDARMPVGYHSLELGTSRFTLAAAPPRCFGVLDAAQSNDALWGIAAQLYSLRRSHDLGYGDFTALAQFVGTAAEHGAAAVALSPVHAMFGANAGSYSPYSPSNRAFLNVLYADAQSLIGDAEFSRIVRGEKLASDIARARRSTLIDWPRSSAIHRRIFDVVFKRFRSGEIAGAAEFADFQSRRGAELFGHACFEALDESSVAAKKPVAASSRTRTFANENRERIAFHQFMQWCASKGLVSAQSAARAREMPIGLIADLAVGVDPRGSECWSQPRNMLIGATIGAPPDALNAIGQNWGLTTFSPTSLCREGFAPFLSILRAAMRYAGGVRLDHVMSLMRLWMVPNGAQTAEGAYVQYPFADLVRLVALESWRHRCIVIGEDLGTVPGDCRARLSQAGILGLDVLPFMRDGKKFLPPKRWRAGAVAMTSTHDIAPVAGWWTSRDLDWRRRLHLFGEVGEHAERAERETAKLQFARAAQISARATSGRVVDAAIDLAAQSPSPLIVVPVEDLVVAREQPNLPGTVGEHPNWRRRYRMEAKRLLDSRNVARRLKRLARARKHAR
jgi:4-alpha-glucanotransferase